MIGEKIRGFFDVTVSQSVTEEFRLSNLKANLSRGKMMAAITLAVEVAIIVASILFKKNIDSDLDAYYYSMYLLFVVVVSFFLLALIKMEANPKLGAASRFVTYGFVFFILAWNMGISFLDQELTSYIIALLAISIIAIIRPAPMFVVYFSVHAIYCALVIIFVESSNLMFSSIINSTIVVIISWSASYILYKNRAENFSTQKELDDQRIELEKVNSELNKANKKLEYLSQTDGLTGIYNRRMFDEVSQDFWEECLREESSLSVVMIDIDHFKIFNDTYGHQAGDDCLKVIVANIKSTIPEQSMLARYGGEEFAILMKASSSRDLFSLAEKIRNTIAGLKIEHKNSPVEPYVTLSLGVYCGTPEEGDSVIGFIAMADKALFQAKNGGRNKTVRG